MERVDVAVIGAGQAGLAAARALQHRGLEPVVMEASQRAAGSWPRYYDSDPDRYPHRDEVTAYLTAYASHLGPDIRLGHRVTEVRADGTGFTVHLAHGTAMAARAVVAASGTFGRPHHAQLPGLEQFTGTVLHAAGYREPTPFAGQRVVVAGSGNSAVQIAAELAVTARTTLTSRRPVHFAPQRVLGRDLHTWLRAAGLDHLPLGRLRRTPSAPPVIDDGRYRAALRAGLPDRRALFTGADGTSVRWPDGTTEHVDTIILATGYRPDLPYLGGLAALNGAGRPDHRGGISTAHPGLAFVGVEWQRTLFSNSLRGAGRDAAHVARHLAAHLCGSR